MSIFKRKQKLNIVEMINFNGQNVSTGAVGAYIVNLYRNEGLRHLGFNYRKTPDGSLRFVIYGLKDNTRAITYFKDRCPAMVENEVKGFKNPLRKFKVNMWSNGFAEVIEDEKI